MLLPINDRLVYNIIQVVFTTPSYVEDVLSVSIIPHVWPGTMGSLVNLAQNPCSQSPGG